MNNVSLKGNEQLIFKQQPFEVCQFFFKSLPHCQDTQKTL